MKITYSPELIKLRLLFENVTRANVKDCFHDLNEQLVFVVDEGEMPKAIGKNGANAKRIEALLKRKIKIVEFAPSIQEFMNHLILPMRAKEIEVDNETVLITPPDSKTRGMIIGRGGANLRNFEQTVQRYFPIKEIKVK